MEGRVLSMQQKGECIDKESSCLLEKMCDTTEDFFQRIE